MRDVYRQMQAVGSNPDDHFKIKDATCETIVNRNAERFITEVIHDPDVVPDWTRR